MRTVDASFEFVRYVAARMRERDYDEFVSMGWCRDREELADSLASRYGSAKGVEVAFTDEGIPAAVGGALELRPGVVTLLFFATPEFDKIKVGLTKYFLRFLLPAILNGGAHRVECVTMEAHEGVHRWLEILGLKREAEHAAYGRSGQKYYTYAWVKDDVCEASG
ncbi:hypothetical protein [Polycladidibacter hongkongensis]|uniref:hypothetical protein n=1 Tax=Polycladidibacter hongkongensis TaxID=1647556 RepID=UPI00082B7E71|nr:hypothetical protein [Pseudovibrio hongkongensis]